MSKEKSDIPLGENDNPIPLVKFKHLAEEEPGKNKWRKGQLTELRRKHKRSSMKF